jgi:hypothetical protein
VPIALVQAEESARGLSLSRAVREIGELEALRESAFVRVGGLPAREPDWDVGIEKAFALAYMAVDDGFGVAPIDADPHVIVNYDRVPKGDVEIRGKSEVTSRDGELLGHIDGFVDDSDAITSGSHPHRFDGEIRPRNDERPACGAEGRTLDLLHGNDTYNLKRSLFAGSSVRRCWGGCWLR